MSRPIRWLSLIALLAILVYFTSTIWLSAIGAYLIQAEEPVRSEAVVVLAGDGFGYRILKGAELVKQGFAPKVFMSGPTGHYGVTEDELAINFAVKRGYPRDYFAGVPNDGRSTREESLVILAELRKQNIHRILLVTSDYHTRRSGRIYRQATDMSVHVVAAPDRYFRSDNWWRTREGRKIVFYEWIKLVSDLFGA